MKRTVYVVVATCLAALAGNGLLALASAASASDQQIAEQELVAQLDDAIAKQLARITVSLNLP